MRRLAARGEAGSFPERVRHPISVDPPAWPFSGGFLLQYPPTVQTPRSG
jgi:hypothetical protein